MGFNIGPSNIGRVKIESPSSNRVVFTTYNEATMTFDSAGRMLLPGTPMFTASGTALAYEYKGAAGWYTVTYSVLGQNNGECFNGGTGRFTAPIAGTYLFTFSAYTYLGAGLISEYMHPTFLVNGSWTSRRGGGSTPYRIRGHGFADTYKDMEMSEIFRLQTSDYVEVYIYHHTTTCGIYSNYKYFTGIFLG
jgi:hypothetical protein